MVLDLCTGSGALLPGLRQKCPSAIGLDFCLPMLELAGARRWCAGLRRPNLVQADALHQPFPGECFDLLTVAFGIRNFADLETGLREAGRILRPGGKILILEFGRPQNRIWRCLYGFYSRIILPLLGGWITGRRAAYIYLRETSHGFPCGEDFCRILGKTGFGETTCLSLSGGICYLYEAVKG